MTTILPKEKNLQLRALGMTAKTDRLHIKRCEYHPAQALALWPDLLLRYLCRIFHRINTLLPQVCLIQLLEPGLACSALVGEVLGIRRGASSCEVVKVRAAAAIEPIAEVLEESSAHWPEVHLEFLHILGTVLHLLPQSLPEVLRNLIPH